MLTDYTPRTQQDRLMLAIYEELVELNKKLSPQIKEELPIELSETKEEPVKKTRRKKELSDKQTIIKEVI